MRWQRLQNQYAKKCNNMCWKQTSCAVTSNATTQEIGTRQLEQPQLNWSGSLWTSIPPSIPDAQNLTQECQRLGTRTECNWHRKVLSHRDILRCASASCLVSCLASTLLVEAVEHSGLSLKQTSFKACRWVMWTPIFVFGCDLYKPHWDFDKAKLQTAWTASEDPLALSNDKPKTAISCQLDQFILLSTLRIHSCQTGTFM